MPPAGPGQRPADVVATARLADPALGVDEGERDGHGEAPCAWIGSTVDRQEFLSARSTVDHRDFVPAGAPPWMAGPPWTVGRSSVPVHRGPSGFRPCRSPPVDGRSTVDRRPVLGPGPPWTVGRSLALVHRGTDHPRGPASGVCDAASLTVNGPRIVAPLAASGFQVDAMWSLWRLAASRSMPRCLLTALARTPRARDWSTVDRVNRAGNPGLRVFLVGFSGYDELARRCCPRSRVLELCQAFQGPAFPRPRVGTVRALERAGRLSPSDRGSLFLGQVEDLPGELAEGAPRAVGLQLLPPVGESVGCRLRLRPVGLGGGVCLGSPGGGRRRRGPVLGPRRRRRPLWRDLCLSLFKDLVVSPVGHA